MKSLLKAIVNGALRRLNLRVINADHNKVSGIFLFEDVRILVESDTPTCIDVGANNGQTIDQIQSTFTRPVIHAFEPSSDTFKKLSSRDYGDLVTLHNCAVGRIEEKRTFHNFHDHFLSSFSQPGSDAASCLPNVEIAGSEEVRVVSVDSFLTQHGISKVDLLKVDTQGWDHEVLLGASQSLKNGTIKVVMIEMNFVELYRDQVSPMKIIETLQQSHFRLVDLYEKARKADSTVSWCTALFFRCSDG